MPWVQALRDRYGERGFRIVALQIACTPDDRETLAEVPELLFFGEAIRDLEDTAALIQCCERVVSVDTLAVHLTGAMGRPARVLLAHTPDWRWQLGRDDSPWYSSIRLLRQGAPGDWDGVVERLVAESGENPS